MHHSLCKGSKTQEKKDLQSCNSSLCALVRKCCNRACKAKLQERGIPSVCAFIYAHVYMLKTFPTFYSRQYKPVNHAHMYILLS